MLITPLHVYLYFYLRYHKNESAKVFKRIRYSIVKNTVDIHPIKILYMLSHKMDQNISIETHEQIFILHEPLNLCTQTILYLQMLTESHLLSDISLWFKLKENLHSFSMFLWTVLPYVVFTIYSCLKIRGFFFCFMLWN